MKFFEFEEDYNNAPYDLEEFAQGAEDVEDKPELAQAANEFLKAKQAFEDALEDAGIEMG
jgi:hypothetical protein